MNEASNFDGSMNNMSVTKIETVPIQTVETPANRLRPVTKDRVEAIVKSYRDNGDFGLITVRPNRDGGYKVVCGAHRLAAAKELGREKIDAKVYCDLSDDQALLIECDENLIRRNTTPEEKRKALVVRKAAYERLHPETSKEAARARGVKAAAAKRKGIDPKEQKAPKVAPTFAEDTAQKTGLHKKTIEKSVKLGTVERNREIAARHERGESLEDLGKEFGISAAAAEEAVSRQKAKDKERAEKLTRSAQRHKLLSKPESKEPGLAASAEPKEAPCDGSVSVVRVFGTGGGLK